MKSQAIKTALQGNAIFSATSGLLLLFFTDTLNEWMGITLNWILPLIGLGLLGFATSLFVLSKKQTIGRKAVITVIIQDALWVLSSIFIVVLGAFGLSESGYEMIIGVAIIVACFGIWQWWCLPKPTTDMYQN